MATATAFLHARLDVSCVTIDIEMVVLYGIQYGVPILGAPAAAAHSQPPPSPRAPDMLDCTKHVHPCLRPEFAFAAWMTLVGERNGLLRSSSSVS